MRFAELSVGQSAEVTRTIRDDDIHHFAELCGDYSAMHFDETYAATTRFGGRIGHGLLTASLLSTVLGMHLPGKGTIYRSQTLRFTAPVYPGDTITARAVITALVPGKRRVTLETTCVNQRGDLVLDGQAEMLMLE